MKTIEEQLEKYSEFLTSNDLVDLGLFVSPDAVYFARARGHSPDFVKMGRKVIYPKSSVIKFIDGRMKLGSVVPEKKEINSKTPIYMDKPVKIDYEKLDKMPEFLSAGDLVEVGIYKNFDHVSQARRMGLGPKYMKVGNRFFYKKEDVIKFISPE